MSTQLEHMQLRTAVMPGWYPMPRPDESVARIWPFEMVGRLGLHGRDAVSAAVSLGDALDRARRQNRPTRLRWVFMGRPTVAVVQAWARLDVVPRSESDAAVSADTWERGARGAAPGDDPAVWRREIARRIVHGDATVVIHDLLDIRERSDAPSMLQHRVVVTRFPAEQLVLSLSVSTPLLAALPDLEATALEFAAGIRIGDPE